MPRMLRAGGENSRMRRNDRASAQNVAGGTLVRAPGMGPADVRVERAVQADAGSQRVSVGSVTAQEPFRLDQLPRSGPRGWLLIAQIVGTVVLAVWIVRQIDFQPLVAQFARLRWSMIALLLAIGVVDRFLAAWKWHILLAAKNMRLSRGAVFRIQMIATFLGNFLPTAVGVDAVRIYLVARVTRRTLDSVSASTVDRLLTLFATVALAAIVLAVPVVNGTGVARGWPTLLPVLIFPATLLAATQTKWMMWLRPIARRVLGDRLTALSSELYTSLFEFHGNRAAVAASSGVTFASFVIRILFVKAVAAALSIDVSVGALWLSLPLTWVALMLPVSLGGLGLQESSYLLALSRVGVAAESAVAISLLDQLIMRIVSLLGAAFWIVARPRWNAAPAETVVGS